MYASGGSLVPSTDEGEEGGGGQSAGEIGGQPKCARRLTRLTHHDGPLWRPLLYLLRCRSTSTVDRTSTASTQVRVWTGDAMMDDAWKISSLFHALALHFQSGVPCMRARLHGHLGRRQRPIMAMDEAHEANAPP
ncbi:hypothetical protein IAQ61_002305 [Plenodomus lingam]|uniref:uncharacterized protein n=1 Tax=Leptosphaeria maculans TaxID=5022 RepID=UPI0033295D6C|nr:hypothetical protein IAQ61_002305 [Plenodomus lingam]